MADQSRLRWRKSTRSGGGGCLEVAIASPDIVVVQDSKNPGRDRLRFRAEDWRRFIDAVTDGEFNPY